MKDASSRRVIIFGADGLRPDGFDPELMPTVSRLAAEGVCSPEHHAVYPTHTRVNISSLATGAHPGRHGIIANTMLAPSVTPDHIIDTGDYAHINALEKASGGQALFAPSLGDLLAARGERLAVAATSTPGASMLWTHRHLGRLVNPASTYGLADLYDLREKLGEIPPREEGALVQRQHYITQAAIRLYLDDPTIRVIVIWYAEPDSSQHHFGLGAPETKTALHTVDACIGDVLDELERRGMRDQFDLFFISDHGHSTVLAHNTLRDYLVQAETEIGCPLPPLATASDYIYTAPGTKEPGVDDLAPLVEWLRAQPWAGVLMGGRDDLAALPGVIPLAALWGGSTNERRPLLAVSPVWSHAPNEFGVRGTVQSLTTQAALRSSHGSLSPYDLHAVLVANGPTFRSGHRMELPTGAIDLMPTVLACLGYPVQTSVQGRVLWEMWQGPQGEPGETHDEVLLPSCGSQDHGVKLHHVGKSVYVHGAVPTEPAID